VDIFCGAGGLSEGLYSSRYFEPVVAIECNESAAQTYAKNFPNAKVLRTRVENVSGKELLQIAKEKGYRHVDAICGGPPCRPFSQSNKGSTRWKVVKKTQKVAYHPDWKYFLCLIKQLDPKFVVAENVMGFRTNRDVFAPFVDRLKKMGYSVAVPILDASKYGIPQKRKRIVIIAVKGNIDEKLLVPNPFDSSVEVKDALLDLPPLTNERSGELQSTYLPNKTSNYIKILKGRQETLWNHQAHSVHPVMKKRFKYIPQGHNLKQAWEKKKIPKGIALSSYVQNGRIRKYTLKAIKRMHSNIYSRLSLNGTSPTLTNARKTVILHPRQHRIVSVRECARLQSFPDRYVFYGSLNQQYQQVADAVPPLLAKVVGSRIAIVYANCQKSRNTASR